MITKTDCIKALKRAVKELEVFAELSETFCYLTPEGVRSITQAQADGSLFTLERAWIEVWKPMAVAKEYFEIQGTTQGGRITEDMKDIHGKSLEIDEAMKRAADPQREVVNTEYENNPVMDELLQMDGGPMAALLSEVVRGFQGFLQSLLEHLEAPSEDREETNYEGRGWQLLTNIMESHGENDRKQIHKMIVAALKERQPQGIRIKRARIEKELGVPKQTPYVQCDRKFDGRTTVTRKMMEDFHTELDREIGGNISTWVRQGLSQIPDNELFVQQKDQTTL